MGAVYAHRIGKSVNHRFRNPSANDPISQSKKICGFAGGMATETYLCLVNLLSAGTIAQGFQRRSAVLGLG